MGLMQDNLMAQLLRRAYEGNSLEIAMDERHTMALLPMSNTWRLHDMASYSTLHVKMKILKVCSNLSLM